MVKFNELRITEDATHLIIDAEILNLPYYEKVAITEVIIQHYSRIQYVKGRPTPGPEILPDETYFSWGSYSHDFSEFKDKEAIPEIEEEYVPVILHENLIGKTINADLDNKGVRHIRLYINKEKLYIPKDIDFSEGLYFVFVKTNINDPEIQQYIAAEFKEVPCEHLKEYTIGITMDIKSVYRRAMCLIKDLIGECKIPKHLIDFILRWKAFKIAVENGDYETAIKFYEEFILDPEKKMMKPFKSCGCNA